MLDLVVNDQRNYIDYIIFLQPYCVRDSSHRDGAYLGILHIEGTDRLI